MPTPVIAQRKAPSPANPASIAEVDPEEPRLLVPSAPAKVNRIGLWARRLIACLLFLVLAAGGLTLGLLIQPIIRKGKEGLVDMPHQVIPLPDSTAIALTAAMVDHARTSLVCRLELPVSKALLESLRSAAARKVSVTAVLPTDGNQSSLYLKSSGVKVIVNPHVNESWIVIDQEILLMSSVPFNSESVTTKSAKITIMRGTIARTFAKSIN